MREIFEQVTDTVVGCFDNKSFWCLNSPLNNDTVGSTEVQIYAHSKLQVNELQMYFYHQLSSKDTAKKIKSVCYMQLCHHEEHHQAVL